MRSSWIVSARVEVRFKVAKKAELDLVLLNEKLKKEMEVKKSSIEVLIWVYI